MELEGTSSSGSAGTAASGSAAGAAPAKKKVKRTAKPAPVNPQLVNLVSKWNAVRTEVRAEEEQAEQQRIESLDPELQAKRKIKEWKAQVIESGEAQRNPNFMPVGDWRKRVAAKK
jgi:hypothetical protein